MFGESTIKSLLPCHLYLCSAQPTRIAYVLSMKYDGEALQHDSDVRGLLATREVDAHGEHDGNEGGGTLGAHDLRLPSCVHAFYMLLVGDRFANLSINFGRKEEDSCCS